MSMVHCQEVDDLATHVQFDISAMKGGIFITGIFIGYLHSRWVFFCFSSLCSHTLDLVQGLMCGHITPISKRGRARQIMSTLSISQFCLLILYLIFHCSDHRRVLSSQLCFLVACSCDGLLANVCLISVQRLFLALSTNDNLSISALKAYGNKIL